MWTINRVRFGAVRDEILTYLEMCSRERMSLQKGMNFRAPPGISILLMSQRMGAPYDDELSDDGSELFYEGHDVQRTAGVEPKTVDQPWQTGTGSLTENAKFANASRNKADESRVLVRVYEKLRQGVWTDKGLFDLVGFTYERKPSEARKVFRFELKLTDLDIPAEPSLESLRESRLIPSWVKQEVFKRDGGKCVLCGSSDQLHFDHDLPFSRGGSSILPSNVRILCARHNLSKGARIQ